MCSSPPVIYIKHGGRRSQAQHGSGPGWTARGGCLCVCEGEGWLIKADAADIDLCLYGVQQMGSVCLTQ